MEQVYKYMVATTCMTYNHVSYIEDALNGFANQNTTFPIVFCVVDDASTDGEQEFLRKWADDNLEIKNNEYSHVVFSNGERYCATLKNRHQITFVIVLLFENHYGKKSKFPYISEWLSQSKYQALCEGDDYWIEPSKIQRQVDYLERNPTIVLTCHRYKTYNQELGVWEEEKNEKLFKGVDEGFAFNRHNNRGWLTKTLSLVFRSEFIKGHEDSLDFVIIYYLMKNGDGYVFNDFWGVYRKHNGGVCSKNSRFENVKRMYYVVKKLYEEDPNNVTRKIYYDEYATMIIITKGKILLHEKFEIKKVLHLPVSYIKKIYNYIIHFFS